MKKVLFATTALVASAGIASAQGIALTGMLEMGMTGGSVYDNPATAVDEGVFQFWTDVDVTFTFSGETDNGLTFGGSVDLDENFAFAGRTQGGETVFLSGSFGTVTMGDTDGAFDWALTEVGMLASIDDAHTAHAGYTGNAVLDGLYDGQIARYDYSFGDFSFAASVQIDDRNVGDPVLAVGAKYSGQLGSLDLGVGVGYTQTNIGGGAADSSAVGGSISLGFAGFKVVGNFTSFDNFTLNGQNANSHMAVGASYTIDAIAITANYGVFDVDNNGGQSGFGVAANYDLGGGASVQAGFGSSTFDAPGSTDLNQFSLGLAMKF